MPLSRPVVIASLIVCLLLAACSAGPTPSLVPSPVPLPSVTASLTSSPTPLPSPSATATLAPTATLTPSPTPLPPLPAAVGTPVLKPADLISPASVAALRELARWGKGRAELVEYSPDGRWLVVKTGQGSYVYPADQVSPEQGHYLEGNLIFAPQGQAAVTITTDATAGTPDSPSGARSAGAGRVDLWQVDGWQRVASWNGSQAVFSTDGKWLALADAAAVRLVSANVANAGAGKLSWVGAFPGADRLLFNAAGNLLVAANHQSVQAWQVEAGTPLKAMQYASVLRLALDPKDDLLLVQARNQDNEAVIEVYRAADWALAATIPASGAFVVDASQSRLFVYSNFPTPGAIQIFDLPSGQPDGDIRAGGSIYRLSVSPDGKTMAASIVDFSASNQQTVGYLKTFDAQGKLLKRLDCGIFCEPQLPMFSPDGKLLAVAGASSAAGVYVGSVFFFDPLTGQLVRTLRGPKAVAGVVEKVVFSPDSLSLAALTGRVDDAVRIWKASDGSLISTLEWGPETLNLSQVSANESLLATYSDAGLTRLQSVLNGTVTTQIDRLNNPVFSPRGDWLAAAQVNSGGQVDGVRLMRAATGELITSFPKNYLGPLAFSPDEELGALFKDFSVQLVKLPGGGFAGTLNAIGKPNVHLTTGAFSPDGKLFAAGSANGEIWIWQVADKKQVFILEGHKINVTALIFTRDGLLSASSDGAVNLWSLADGKLLKTIDASALVRGFAATQDDTFGQLSGLAQSPDGSLLAVSGVLNPLQPAPLRVGVTLLITPGDGALLRVLPGGGGSDAFAADGKILYTSGDGAVHQWGLLP